MNNYQGKRKDQVEFSEKMVIYSIAGIAIMIAILSLYNFVKSLINE